MLETNEPAAIESTTQLDKPNTCICNDSELFENLRQLISFKPERGYILPDCICGPHHQTGVYNMGETLVL